MYLLGPWRWKERIPSEVRTIGTQLPLLPSPARPLLMYVPHRLHHSSAPFANTSILSQPLPPLFSCSNSGSQRSHFSHHKLLYHHHYHQHHSPLLEHCTTTNRFSDSQRLSEFFSALFPRPLQHPRIPLHHRSIRCSKSHFSEFRL